MTRRASLQMVTDNQTSSATELCEWAKKSIKINKFININKLIN